MVSVLRALASVRLTVVGMLLLACGSVLSYGNPEAVSIWVLVVPLAFLALNLSSAIITNPRIHRRKGLLVFHSSLLGIVLLAAIGRLTYLDAHLEIINGATFDAQSLLDLKAGPLHSGRLSDVEFIQGRYTVDYRPGMSRGATRSYLQVPDGEGGWREQVVGDDTPLVVNGYRFYTSFHKGFSPIVVWTPNNGQPEVGTIHMPPYPLFDYRQANRWTPPQGEEIKFWLRLNTGISQDSAWVLDGQRATGVLVVDSGEQRVELQPGETVVLSGGELRYQSLTTWMGYKVFYDPTIHWLFFVSVLGVLGLSYHYWTKVSMNSVAGVNRRSLDEPGQNPTDRSRNGGAFRSAQDVVKL
ncbi:MAG: hypothetical protein GXP10_04165 [Gammaproteobacteria bacterium]|nr:hypothetical protein [Gammaproteobacteria bacterium]